jgi:hypothetical protein
MSTAWKKEPLFRKKGTHAPLPDGRGPNRFLIIIGAGGGVQ